uniref:TAFA chemokine like family member 5 n=1 Tax=Scleropages formosus TaxID=113540 RepID=A0A8C9S7Z0_SCLFO
MRGTRPRCVQVARRHSLGHGDTRRLLFRVLSAAGRDRRLSMAPRAGRTEGGDAGGRPTTTTMSATLWAALVLAVLLIACCSQLAAGTCEIVTLDRDSSQPRRTVARQTARCACRKGQIAGTTRARPACVDGLLTAVGIQTSLEGLQDVFHFSPQPDITAADHLSSVIGLTHPSICLSALRNGQHPLVPQ